MYKLIKHFGDSRHAFLLKAKYSCTVNVMFDKKRHVLLCIDLICDLLSKWTLHINKNQGKIVVAIQEIFHSKQIKNVKPFLEITQYVTMLNVDNFDWKGLKEKLQPLIHDDEVSTPAFYCFLDGAMKLAIKNEISIETAVGNMHLLQQLKFANSSQSFERNWFTMILPAYDHADYVKYQSQLAKAGAQMGTNPSQTNNNTNFPNYDLFGRPLASRNTRPQNQSNGNGNKQPTVSQKVRQWCNEIKPKLNDKYLKLLKNHCSLWNMKDAKCNKANSAYCWMYNERRSHSCLCGSNKHRAWQCKEIYKR